MTLAPSSAAVAGLVLAALPHLARHDLPAPTATAVLEATGVARTTAYAARARVQEALPSLLRPPGRPLNAPSPPLDEQTREALHRAVLTHLFDHPGCVTGTDIRRRYSPGFRLFVLEQCARYPQVDLQRLTDACGVPLPTLKDWLGGDSAQVKHGLLANLSDIKPEPALQPTLPQLETLLDAWARWHGGFRPFCEHAQLHLRLPFSRQHISDILESQGVRIPKRRRPDPDYSALKQGFETFFPGAQWVGDGTQLTVTVNGQPHTLNFELLVDAHTGAFPGVSIRPTEDALAVTQAFEEGVLTATTAPLALLLDNKPSNHCDEVTEALGDTLLLRSRPFVPTDKPHAEGAFGLFKQHAPEMNVYTADPVTLATQIATLAVTLWGRALNHLPRKSRGDRSRVQLYADKPTDEEIRQATQALQDRLLKHRRAQKTRAQRQDPLIRQMVADAFGRLGLDDPQGQLLTAIASWPLDAILAGIAIFEARLKTGSLPDGVDARYLRGIIKNIAQEDEGLAFAALLLKARIDARDRSLAPLDARRERLDEDNSSAHALLIAYLDHALESTRRLDRTFWLLCAVDLITSEDDAERAPLLRVAARRIHSSSAIPHRERLAATRFLFARVLPLD